MLINNITTLMQGTTLTFKYTCAAIHFIHKRVYSGVFNYKNVHINVVDIESSIKIKKSENKVKTKWCFIFKLVY